MEIIEGCKQVLDTRGHVDYVLMDLSEALDCLPYRLVLYELRKYDVIRNTYQSVGSYCKTKTTTC